MGLGLAGWAAGRIEGCAGGVALELGCSAMWGWPGGDGPQKDLLWMPGFQQPFS